MMLEKLKFVDLHESIRDKLVEKTGLECYSSKQDGERSNYYYIDIVNKKDISSKTMYLEAFTLWIHCIVEADGSKEDLYGLIEKMEEALTEEITLPPDFCLVMHTQKGMQPTKKEDSGEWHGIVEFEFMVSYGFKTRI